MRVTVRLFAMQRERIGTPRVELDLADGADIAEAWERLVARHPVLAVGAESVRFARNGVYAQPTERLAESDELAVIPPVAGGGGRFELTERPIRDEDVARLLRETATDADGAVVTFLGRTRESPGTPAPGEEAQARRHLGRRVLALDYEAFESMARGVFVEIADEAAGRFGVERLAILHRTGLVPLGEISVAVVAAAAHREAAFDACEYAIDELKARAPIWKSERYADGTVWLGAPARTTPTSDAPTDETVRR